jgi:phage terminase large subunit
VPSPKNFSPNSETRKVRDPPKLQLPADNPLLELIARYDDTPDGQGWVDAARDLLGFEADEKQAAVLRDIATGERRVAVRSGHGVGKTTVLAIAIILHALFRFPQKTVCTAPTSGQLFDALAAEVKTWIGRLAPELQSLFEVKSERIELKLAPTESFIAFNTSRPEKPEAMAGVHSDNVLLVCDEASGIPEPVYEAGAGSMSGHNAVTVLAGNPVRTTGLFFDVFHKLRDLWKTHHISCVGHPRISPDFVQDMARRYGEDSNAFRVRVLGEFPKGDDDTVIPFELAEAALLRDVQPTMVQEIWGLDCARFGSDSSALARRKGNTLAQKVEEVKGWDTMQVVGWVKSKYDACMPSERPSEILVDVIGIGAGVTDRLIELGLPARGINVAETPAVDSHLYADVRTELWFKGRFWLDKRDCHLAGDDGLVAELVGPRFKFSSNGKKRVESKDDMKKRGLRSPNKADAFLLTLAGEAITALHGSKSANSSWNKPLRRDVGVV